MHTSDRQISTKGEIFLTFLPESNKSLNWSSTLFLHPLCNEIKLCDMTLCMILSTFLNKKQPINKPINQSINQSTNQPMNQSIKHKVTLCLANRPNCSIFFILVDFKTVVGKMDFHSEGRKLGTAFQLLQKGAISKIF